MGSKRLVTLSVLGIALLSMVIGALTFVTIINPVKAEEAQGSSRFWAVLVHADVQENDTDYMYNTLNGYYDFTDIYYLHNNTSDPRVNNSSTKANIRWAINTWLPSKSEANDTILIFFTTHGGGYQVQDYDSIHAGPDCAGIWDFNDHDEGDEHPEDAIKISLGSSFAGEDFFVRLWPAKVDVDGDGFKDDIFRCRDLTNPFIDAWINNNDIGEESYWVYDLFTDPHDWDKDGVTDDILLDYDHDNHCDIDINANISVPESNGEDLDNDGFIDTLDFNEDDDYDDYVGADECLYAMNKQRYLDDEIRSDLDNLEGKYKTLIFMTQSCYGGGLIDDLSKENRIIMTASNETSAGKGDQNGDGYFEWSGAFIDALHGATGADNNADGHVSIKEAWDYAYEHDTLRQSGWETPWLDDNWNGLPTFANGTYVPDEDDGDLAADTWFPKKFHLTVETYNFDEQEIPGSKIWINGDQTEELSPTTVIIREGNYTVKVEMSFYNLVHYTFDHWEDNSTNNERNLGYVDSSMTIRAYYRKEQLPPGGCPFVYTWNGQEYVIDNNLLPLSRDSAGIDVEDYYMLHQMLIRQNGWHKLMIGEYENEHSYFDQIQLLAVDHESDVQVAVTSTGRILTYRDPKVPISAVDNNGENVLSLLTAVDENHYEGRAEKYIILDFGDVDVSDGAKLVMRADGEKEAWSVRVQVLNASLDWTTIATLRPRVYWATEIVDLAGYLPNANGELKVRLYFTDVHLIDYLGLDTSKQGEFEVRYATIVSATHSECGDVKETLIHSDNIYAELLPGEEITLEFTIPRNKEDIRDFIIIAEGHYFTITP